MRQHTPFVDYFVICTTQNRIQSEAVVDALHEGLGGYHHREGGEGSDWILVDFRDIAVHVMLPEAHRFYDLERLWGDAPKVAYEETARVP